MKLTRDEYEKLRARKPSVCPALDTVATQAHSKPPRTLVSGASPKPRSQGSLVRGGRIRVTLVAAVQNRTDSDNLSNAMKPLRDAIAAYLGIDDGDEDRITWECGQVETRGQFGVMVKIEQ